MVPAGLFVFNSRREVIPVEEYILRLIRAGYKADNAWSSCMQYLQSRDYDGLEAFIARAERGKHCGADVVEEVLAQVGLETI